MELNKFGDFVWLKLPSKHNQVRYTDSVEHLAQILQFILPLRMKQENWFCIFFIVFILWCCRQNSFRLLQDQEKTSNLSQVTDKLYHIMLYTLPWSRYELTTSMVIGTDCIGSCKSNYHTITAMTAPRMVSV